jgi:hypothetical protein
VGHRDLVADADDAADGRAHPGQLAVIEDRLGQQRIRRDQRRLQGVLGVLGRGVLGVRLGDALGAIADATSPPACPPIPRPRGRGGRPHRPESWLLDRIFPTCEIGRARGRWGSWPPDTAEARSSSYRIVTGVPRGTGTAGSPASRRGNVPFVESRSWIDHWSSQSIAGRGASTCSRRG